MTVKFDNAGIADPPLEFAAGVAAIDMFTLNRAGLGVAELGFDIQLPVLADVNLPGVFNDLCEIKVSPGPTVTATIDTQKMRWAVDGGSISRDSFTDYDGAERYAVKFNNREVMLFDGLGLAVVPTKLPDGRGLQLWFAEIPVAELGALGYYGLYAKAADLSRRARDGRYEKSFIADWITIPAQQLKWKRRMDEILRVNRPQLEDIEQRVYLALDETGVRVKAVTAIRAASFVGFGPSKTYHFGERHPVAMWLTEPGSVLPFAVIVTTAEAWLDPDADVSFADDAFIHEEA
jgi:hypothetical protein